MIEGVIIGVVVGIVMLVVNAMVHRMSIQTRTDRLEKDIEEIKEGQSLIMKSLIAILIALRDGKTNGECSEALHNINEYLTNNIKK